jgi:chloramphenicol 3-O phosphotransferase
MDLKNGHVVFLNGTSSSGKTTIAKALQQKLTAPYMLVSIDGFFYMYPERFLSPESQEDALVLADLIPTVVSGLHGSVAALAKTGNNIIVDHVLQEDGWLQECVEKWTGLDVLFVGVTCPLEIVEQRERDRGNRNIGTARHQFGRVHAHGLYDVEVDTSVLNLDECAMRIMELINNKPQKSAFQELAIRFRVQGSTWSNPK